MNSFKGKSTRLRVGCQTYTWEMLGDRWTGSADDLLAGIADGGYAGIEITDTMIGHYADRPNAFAAALEKHGLTLVAFACGSASGWRISHSAVSGLMNRTGSSGVALPIS